MLWSIRVLWGGAVTGGLSWRTRCRLGQAWAALLAVLLAACAEDKVAQDACVVLGNCPGNLTTAPVLLDGGSGDASVAGMCPGPSSDQRCDLGGYWGARMSVFSRSPLLSGPQVSNVWYFWQIEDQGERFEVVDHLDCQIRTVGLADVVLPVATEQALFYRNPQQGRPGRYVQQGDSCDFWMERHYNLRGIDHGGLVPERFADRRPLADLNPLPSEANLEQALARAEDWDMDGLPGVTFLILGYGKRHTMQRDWTQYFSAPPPQAPERASYQVALDADRLTVSALFDSEETVLGASDCGEDDSGTGFECNLIRTTADPANEPHFLQMVRLGRCAQVPELANLLESGPLALCQHIEALLPQVAWDPDWDQAGVTPPSLAAPRSRSAP